MRAQKKIKQTNAIFDRLKQINPEADGCDNMLRLSLDAKAAVKVGAYSRKGKNRVLRKADDHDYNAKEVLTPYGIFLPHYDDLWLYFTTSRLTSDFMVDVLDRWWQGNKEQFPLVTTLVINQDNGPENKSRRTQFLKRMVEFARRWRLLVRLAYYPPYHSKYNPIEHCWGVLESHWSGDLLDSRAAVLGFARSMTWNGNHPKVELLTSIYPKGVRLAKKEMLQVEDEVKRLPDLDDWFVDIPGHELPPLG
jgi:Rhodopirellula transposase DDE domain